MLKKNLDLYKERYATISKNQLKRINEFISNSKFSNKDLGKFEEKLDYIVNIPRETIKIIFYIIPEVTPRPRLNFKHGNFYVRNAKTNNDFMKLVINNEEDFNKYIYRNCEFECRLYFPIPAGMNKVDTLLAEVGAIRPVNNKDWDNLGKTYSDLIQKWLLLNDSLVVSGTSKKFYSLKPRVEIELEYLTEYDCKFNQKQIENTKVYKREFDIDKV